MSFFDLLTLFGGLAMFLYGMRLMGDGLQESSSGTLKVAMEHVTNNPFKAFLLGLAVTALIQSSTATIVITAGLVAAGILTLHQSLGIIVGANVGTTVTGQIIRLLDMDASAGSWLQIFKPSSLAPIALIIGIVMVMGGHFKNSHAIGNIAIGFGILFSGLLNMTGAVDSLTQSGVFETMLSGLGDNPFLGYVSGAAVAFILQSSSASVGILQAFSSSGLLSFKGVYPVIIGIYLGDCVTTAIVCWIGAKPDARRTGIVNILFNLCKSALVFVAVAVIHRIGLLDGLWDKTVNSGIIADTNTVFNLGCALALFPLLNTFERMSLKIVRDEKAPENKYKDKLDGLNPVFFNTPAIALRSCYSLLLSQFEAAGGNVRSAIGLLSAYDGKTKEEINNEESNIDLMTDRGSRYIVELLPHLQEEYHISILDQYYKVISEFERIGDEAVRIADTAEDLSEHEVEFSDVAKKELQVLTELTERMLVDADIAFRKRDEEAAYRIEPYEDVAKELINTFKVNHLNRMGSGKCNIYADADFMNLLSSFKRIASACTNIGEAVVIRVNPELATSEHNYFETLRSGNNAWYNEAYKKAHGEFFGKLPEESLELRSSAPRAQAPDTEIEPEDMHEDTAKIPSCEVEQDALY
ncbi:MAG: Na/Pi cotransporter family protein [Lachnospiraceae bacterium]|nr:Na/Pi cotransporter family protein [Lachnospiraceae bacterium]